MVWLPVGAWIAAVLVAVVVLGFCAYELMWKAKRLRRDLGQLQVVAGQLQELRDQLATTQARAAATGLR